MTTGPAAWILDVRDICALFPGISITAARRLMRAIGCRRVGGRLWVSERAVLDWMAAAEAKEFWRHAAEPGHFSPVESAVIQTSVRVLDQLNQRGIVRLCAPAETLPAA